MAHPFWPKILHRRAAAISLGAILLSVAVAGQQPRGLRGLAVVEWISGRARLMPVAIYYDKKFYDATVYKATPVPLALLPETVYEAERSGTAEGLFTVERARQVKGLWWGEGRWQPRKAVKPDAEKPKEAASAPRDDDGPPVLRRPSATDPKEQTKAEEKPAAPPEEEDDPNRPVLRRGKPPEPAKAEPEPPPQSAKAGVPEQVLVAVSDPSPARHHSYIPEGLRPEEQQRFESDVRAIATAELQRYLGGRTVKAPPAQRGRKPATPPVVPAPQLSDVQIRTFELAFNNEPVLVLTAGAQPPAGTANPADLFVTVVARVEGGAEMRKVFAQVTDASRLDAIPRLQLIDAVDAEGNGRAELLFRRISDASHSYVIYQVGRDRLWELFQGAESR